MSTDLAAFLLARIAEDEAAARKATQGRWMLWGMSVMADPAGRGRLDNCLPVAQTTHEDGLREWNARHIARWDPARVLAECEARRRIVELHEPYREHIAGSPCAVCADEEWPCETLRLLTLPFTDHPDLDPSWRL